MPLYRLQFEELLNEVEKVGKKIHGIGELTAYDTKHRIGIALDIPLDGIYMHAGTRKLFGRKITERKLLKCDFPELFNGFSEDEIENMLCEEFDS